MKTRPGSPGLSIGTAAMVPVFPDPGEFMTGPEHQADGRHTKALPRLITRIILAALLILALGTGAALAEVAVSLHPAVLDQGGVGVIQVTGLPDGTRPEGGFYGKPIIFFSHNGGMAGFVPVDVMLKPGRYSVRLTWADADRKQTRDLSLTVRSADYGTRSIDVDSSMVNLSREDLERAQKEKKLVSAALSVRSPEKLWDGAFGAPLDSKIISPFGRKTVINGELSNRPHSGVDLRGVTGEPVRAPAAGRVLLAGNHFFAGGSIYLDHGQGLISMYFHLSGILVKDGLMVEKGQVIGKVGATGRVTGPHLHYGIYLQGARISPLVFQGLTETLAAGNRQAPVPEIPGGHGSGGKAELGKKARSGS